MRHLVPLALSLLLVLLTAELSRSQTPELVVQTGYTSEVTSVVFSPDGKTLASGSNDKTVRFWDVKSATELRSLTGHTSFVTSVSFSPDGKTVASGSDDQTIKLWDVVSGSELRTLSPNARVNSVSFSPDGKILASGNEDKTVTLWDVTSGEVLRSLSGHSASVNSACFSPDGKILASGSDDKTIKLWDVASGRELRSLIGHSSDVNTIAFSPDGKSLASGSNDSLIKLWDVATGKELATFSGHSSAVRSISFSPDGKTLASGSWDTTIKLWDVEKKTELRTLPGEANSITGWPHSVLSVAFSRDGKILASGTNFYTIKLWDIETGKDLRTLSGHSSVAYSVAISRDGRSLATGNRNNTVKLWDIETGKELRTLAGHSQYVWSVSFSPDGKILASGSWDKTIKLWDVASGKELRTLTGHTNSVYKVWFGVNGAILGSFGDDYTFRIWNVESGNQLESLDTRDIAKTKQRIDQLFPWPPSEYYGGATSYSGATSDRFSAKLVGNGKISLLEKATNKELATLIAFDENDWIVVTPDGLFDGSLNAWNKILWRFNHNTFDYAPVEAFFNEYYYPGLLAEIFAGRTPKPQIDVSRKDRRQILVTLKTPSSVINATSPATSRTLTVEVTVEEAPAGPDVSDKSKRLPRSGARDVRLFRNGSLVRVWRGDLFALPEKDGCKPVPQVSSQSPRRRTCTASVPIVAGANNFTAYAFNGDNIKSSDATLVITGADSLKRQGTAYILAVGINRYSNSRYNLKYAVADAQDFAAEVKRRQELLKRYAKVEVVSLVDTAATKANITQTLAQLATKVQPEDAVIVYFAGHGTAQGKQFYLIPHDLGYNGPRESLSKAGLQTILAHSISDRDLEKLFEGIDAGQLLLVIDACNSGQALEAEEKRRGPMNSKGLAQLAYEKGMYVLTAAQSYQAAQEAAKFGHGFLTYALVEEGLKRGAADREPKNGAIDLREWLNYATDEVPRMQEQNSLEALRGRGRFIYFVGDGSRSGDANKKNEARDNIQRPRLFYRRELDANPLVIAVVGATTPQ